MWKANGKTTTLSFFLDGLFPKTELPYMRGSIMDSKLPVHHRTGRSLDNIPAVCVSFAESPDTSIRHRSQELDIPRSTMQRILTKDLHLHTYEIQLTQELKPTDHVHRREFVNWLLENQTFGR
jgi:hypothetical protein